MLATNVERKASDLATPSAAFPLRLLIVEECLVGPHGHYLNFVSGIAAANMREGVAVTVLANCGFDPALLPGVEVVPLFRKTWMQTYSAAARPLRLLACLRHNLRNFTILWQYLGRSGEFDAVLATHANVFSLIAWKLLSVTRLRKARMLLDSLAPLWVFKYEKGELVFVPQAKFSRFVYRLFRPGSGNPRCRVGAETEHDARVLERWSGTPVVVLPTPRSPALIEEATRVLAGESPAGRGEGGIVRLGWIGRASWDRGFPLFVEAVERLVAGGAKGNLQFVVQLFHVTGDLPPAEKRIIELAEEGDAVTLAVGAFANEEYARLLCSVDGLVLPYKRDDYVGRNSSLALDAFACGVPMITTEGTWMAEQMNEWGAGIPVRDGDVDDLVRAIGEFQSRAAELRATARQRAATALEENSWRRLLKILWASAYCAESEVNAAGCRP